MSYRDRAGILKWAIVSVRMVCVICCMVAGTMSVGICAEETSESSGTLVYPMVVDEGRTSFKNTLVVGSEYDSNVFKTYSDAERRGDGLTRAYFSNKGDVVSRDSRERVGYHLQLGGKKYFTASDEDAILGNGMMTYSHLFREDLSSTLDLAVKGKLQSQSYGDFADMRVAEAVRYDLSENYFYTGRVSYELFTFDTKAYTYHEGVLHNELGWRMKPVVFTGRYLFGNTLFPEALPSKSRWDQSHDFGLSLQYHEALLFQLGYDYVLSTSNESVYDYDAHRVSALLGYEVFRGTMLNLLATLNYRVFKRENKAAVEDQQKEEVTRLVRSESEDLTFNSIIVNVSQRLTEQLSLEVKYSRYSNELSSISDHFSRHLVNLSVKARF